MLKSNEVINYIDIIRNNRRELCWLSEAAVRGIFGTQMTKQLEERILNIEMRLDSKDQAFTDLTRCVGRMACEITSISGPVRWMLLCVPFSGTGKDV